MGKVCDNRTMRSGCFVLRSSHMLVALLLFLASQCALSQTVELQSRSDFYQELASYASAFVDSSGTIPVESVLSQQENFAPVETKYIDFGRPQGQVWVKSTLRNATDTQGVWRFDINRQYYKHITVYLVREGQDPQLVLSIGPESSLSDRPLQKRTLGVDINFASGEQVDVYTSVRTEATSFMPLGIGTVEATVRAHAQEHAYNVLFNGALFVLVGVALLLVSVIGWRLSLSFSAYLLAGVVYVTNADGYFLVHLWPNNMWLHDPMNLTFICLMPVCGIMFSRMLFDFKKHAPKLDRILFGYILTTSIVALLAIPIYEIDLLKIIAYLFPVAASALQISATVIAWRNNLLGAKPYAVGTVMILLSFIYAASAHVFSGNFDHDTTLDFGHFALIIEGLAFIAAIAIRLVGLRNERDLALNAELTATQEKLRLSTELQQAQDSFIQARKMAEVRKQQLSSVSHDLQQPLVSLRAALNNMGGSDEDAAQQMHSAFDYLEKLAREQLAAGKEDSAVEQVQPSQEKFPVSVVLDNVKEMFEEEAKAKGLDFRYQTSNIAVKTDPVALMRAVSNLVSNAIKHSDSGGVLMAARYRADKARIEVWDTGSGMSEEELERYQKPHEKGDESQGSGLGLSIVNRIAEEMGLDFKMSSRQGRGSVAFLYIPLR